MCEWCKDYSKAKQDPADLGPMYNEDPEWRGPNTYGPIYDEFAHWVEYQKGGRFKRWLKSIFKVK